ncbi:MAG: hypothetical protein HWE30_16935 [Methylocystaceae bacterium]|nr:hypothetical protein [Methylocystaceae bacterium]
MRKVAFILWLFCSGITDAFANNPLELYGDKIEFDVMRNGEVVGEHITRFSQNGDELRVSSHMNIDISLLFLPVYSFDYAALEKWVAGKMVFLDVNVVDGSDRVAFTAEHQKDGLRVQMDGRETEIMSDIITTNHWNVDVVKDNQVLNTLTGNLNAVTITPMGQEEIDILNGSMKAMRYDYSGDLMDTSVWYDDQGRWVKLRFLARDGSTIEYRCRTCKARGQG